MNSENTHTVNRSSTDSAEATKKPVGSLGRRISLRFARDLEVPLVIGQSDRGDGKVAGIVAAGVAGAEVEPERQRRGGYFDGNGKLATMASCLYLGEGLLERRGHVLS